MPVQRAQQRVHEAAIVGEEEQPSAGLVEAANAEEALFVFHL